MTTPDVGTVPRAAPVLDGEAVLARLGAPRTSQPTTLGVIADPHVATEAEGTWKGFDLTERHLRRAVERIDALDVDGVVVLGDLTKDGEPRNFERYDDLLAPLSVPVVTVPGNHDVPKAFDDHAGHSLASFSERYAPDGYPDHERLGTVDVVGLNTAAHHDGALRDGHAGLVSERQRRSLDAVLAEAETPLVVMHHNLYELPHNPGGNWRQFPLDNPGPLRETLAAHGVDLVLSGHQHLPGTDSRDGVRELLVPAVCSYPQSVLTVHVGPAGTTVRVHPLGTPDELRAAYERSVEGSALGRGIAARAAIALESLPLVDERRGDD